MRQFAVGLIGPTTAAPAGTRPRVAVPPGSARLAEALRRRDYDVETTVEAGTMEASDEEQLAYAVSQQRALVTHNIKPQRSRTLRVRGWGARSGMAAS